METKSRNDCKDTTPPCVLGVCCGMCFGGVLGCSGMCIGIPLRLVTCRVPKHAQNTCVLGLHACGDPRRVLGRGRRARSFVRPALRGAGPEAPPLPSGAMLSAGQAALSGRGLWILHFERFGLGPTCFGCFGKCVLGLCFGSVFWVVSGVCSGVCSGGCVLGFVF